ncbi:MAG: hypothetical protein HC933_23080 [Pleurocapsa sp. SU_196_0]|nr:hypothetical protein [Pleurocapsa sp. SU_196_0]
MASENRTPLTNTSPQAPRALSELKLTGETPAMQTRPFLNPSKPALLGSVLLSALALSTSSR